MCVSFTLQLLFGYLKERIIINYLSIMQFKSNSLYVYLISVVFGQFLRSPVVCLQTSKIVCHFFFIVLIFRSHLQAKSCPSDRNTRFCM